MNKIEKQNSIHHKWKKQFVLNEVANPKDVNEYECYFKLRINANKTDAKLEEILVYIGLLSIYQHNGFYMAIPSLQEQLLSCDHLVLANNINQSLKFLYFFKKCLFYTD